MKFSELLARMGLNADGYEATEVFSPEVAANVELAVPPKEERKYFEELPYSWHRHVLNYEGGYVNHPNDRGGETNLGVTSSTLERAKKRGIAPQSVTIEELGKHPDVVYNIYNLMYYKDPMCDKLPAMLSFAFHDACVNHGRGGRNSKGNPVGAGMLLQDILIQRYNKKIAFDGVVGRNTIAALNEVLEFESSSHLTEYFNNRRRKYFKDIVASNPSQKVFLNGWMSRMDKVEDMCRKRVM